ncbi:adhesive plaque matrix protein-like isoform X1 [Hoplias malabaricus]|uniref:adhesive plaque matrix protein-like isoform X1 n=1 Tax=Hoplias malabaricus TaxID=27720 RepID=UPI0034634E67
MLQKMLKLIVLLTAVMLSPVRFCQASIREEVSDRVIRHGTLVVGDQNKRKSSEMEGGFGVNPNHDGDTEGFQSDQPQDPVEHQMAQFKLQSLKPSVQCGDESMTLRMLGKTVPDFLVESGEGSPVPLSQVPARCGFSVKRARRDVLLIAKYDGCHISKEGDSYILPLRMWGAPVKMSCPVANPLTVTCSPSAMLIHIARSTGALTLKVMGEWEPLGKAVGKCKFTLEADASGWIVTAPYTSSCFKTKGTNRLLSVLCMYGELTLSCPVALGPTTTLPAEMPPHPQYQDPYGHSMLGPWPLYDHPPAPKIPTAAPTTTAPPPTKARADQPVWNPLQHVYAGHWPQQYGYPPAPKIPTAAPTAPPPTKARADQPVWNPLQHGYSGHWPHRYGYPFSHHRKPTAPPPTKARADQPVWDPLHAVAHWPHQYGYPPAPKIPTAAPTAPPPTKARADQPVWNPLQHGYSGHWPHRYGYPLSHHRKPTAPPPTKARADQPVWDPLHAVAHWPHQYGYPPAPKIPTPAPTTTAPPPTKARADQPVWNPLQHGWSGHWPHRYGYPLSHHRKPTAPPPTKARADQPVWDPFHAVAHWPHQYGYPPAPKIPTAAPTAPPPTKARADQPVWNPLQHGWSGHWPHRYGYPLSHHRKPTAPPPTKARADQPVWDPFHAVAHWPNQYGYPPAPKVPTAAPTTAPPPTKARADQPVWNPFQQGYVEYWSNQYGYPLSHPKSPTLPPQTTTSTTPAKPSIDQLWYPHDYSLPDSWQPYFGEAGATPSATVAASTTVKPPIVDQPISYDSSLGHVPYNPLSPVQSHSPPVPDQVGVHQKYQMPWMFYPHRYSGSQPVATSSAGSQSVPLSETAPEMKIPQQQPVYLTQLGSPCLPKAFGTNV